MKKIVLAFALSAVTLSVHAKWLPIDGSPAGVKLYVNNETAEKSGPRMVLLWHVIDYVGTQSHKGKDFRSQMLRYDYDCDKAMFREMFRSWHKGAMATDMTVSWTEGQRQWLVPEPSSIDEALTHAACASIK